MITKQATFQLSGLRCAGCVTNLETALNQVSGLSDVHVNLMMQVASFSYEPEVISTDRIKSIIQESGYQVEKILEASHNEANPATFDNTLRQETRKWRTTFILSALASLPFIIHMFWDYLPVFPTPEIVYTVWLICGAFVWSYGGRSFHLGTLKGIAHRRVNMDTLISLGSTTAFGVSVAAFISYWAGAAIPGLSSPMESAWHHTTLGSPTFYFETSAMIITFIVLGRWIESMTRIESCKTFQQLSDSLPKHVLRCKDTQWESASFSQTETETVPIERIQPGDVIKVLPGSQIPIDGIVLHGASWINDAIITGESRLKEVEPKSTVYGGSINTSGVLLIQATTVSTNTTVAQMIQMITQAQTAKLPIQRYADRIASVLVPLILWIALAAGVVWSLIFQDVVQGLNPVISILIITCPCAIGLAAPVSILVGITEATKYGILFRDGSKIEMLPTIQTIVTDKTGTLTQGTPTLIDSWVHTDYSENEVLSVVYTLEKNSEHPFAQYFHKLLGEAPTLLKVNHLQNHVGKGISAEYDSKIYRVGSQAWLTDFRVDMVPASDFIRSHVRESHLIFFVACEETLIGSFAFADALRPETIDTILTLKHMNKQVILATGDSEPIGKILATEVGIHRVYTEMLPGDKVALIKRIQEEKEPVIMLGDGINDAAALKTADIGIAVCTGTDIAKDSADIVFLKGGLDKIIQSFTIAELTFRTIQQNMVWAIVYNLLCLPLAAGILVPFLGTGFMVPPMVAALAMGLSSISVVTNSILLRWRIHSKLTPQ